MDSSELDEWEKEYVADVLSEWKPALGRIRGLKLNDDDICRIAQVAQGYEQARSIKDTRARQKVCTRLIKAIDQTIAALNEAEANHLGLGSLRIDLESVTDKLKQITSRANRHAQAIEARIRRNRPRDEVLRNVVVAALAPYRRLGRKGPGVYWDASADRYRGRVLELVHNALRTAGIPEQDLPAGRTLINIVAEIEGK